MFDQLVVSGAAPAETQRKWTVMFSSIGQSGLLGLLILMPLIYTEALPNGMLRTMLVAPPPPRAPAASTSMRKERQARVIPLTALRAPISIPRRPPTSEPGGPPVEYLDVVPGGDANGNPLNDLLRPATPAAPTAPSERQTQRIQVGGRVEAAAIISQELPQYPAIAKAAHVSGTVVLHAVIAKDGTVEELAYVSGPSLLLKSAMDAVRQWRYRPTMLNGQAVEVETTIDVVFNLGG